ncbi:hypothetical protein [Xanthomonas arboricola]|uniref:hypothetical protein n=1 Tax=Xanthomonas arboricola TaxID=56448 RepID=UPI002B2CDF69|nr:hypothetical protein X12_003702 [Xanthomonas arboricola]
MSSKKNQETSSLDNTDVVIDLEKERAFWQDLAPVPFLLKELTPEKAWPLYVQIYSLLINRPRCSPEELRAAFVARRSFCGGVALEQKRALFERVWLRIETLAVPAPLREDQ